MAPSNGQAPNVEVVSCPKCGEVLGNYTQYIFTELAFETKAIRIAKVQAQHAEVCEGDKADA